MSIYDLVPRPLIRWMVRRAVTARSGFWHELDDLLTERQGPDWQRKLPENCRPR